MTRLTTCPDAESAAQRAAQEVLRHLEEARMQGRTPHVALSGGGTPKRTYELLAREPEQWAEAEVGVADERCVPPDDEESNYRLAALALLDPAGIPAQRVHRMERELVPERGAQRYAQLLRERLDGHPVPVLDLIVLGIGPDGHVASLFPRAPTLQAAEDEVCLTVHDPRTPPPQRITLRLPVLRSGRR